MNRQQATTAPRAPARAPFDYRGALLKLDIPVGMASSFVQVLDQMAESISLADRHNGFVRLTVAEVDNLVFIISQTKRAVDAVDEAFLDAGRDERAVVDPSIDRVADALHAEASPSASLMQFLIEAHRSAWREMEAASVEDEKTGAEDPAHEGSERAVLADQEQQRAFDRLIMWSPASAAESAERMRYLFLDPCSPWSFGVPARKKLELLLRSMEGAI